MCLDCFSFLYVPLTHSLCLSEHGTPTSVAFVNTDPSQVVVSFDGGETLLYDLNTEQSIMVLETQTKDGKLRVIEELTSSKMSLLLQSMLTSEGFSFLYTYIK